MGGYRGMRRVLERIQYVSFTDTGLTLNSYFLNMLYNTHKQICGSSSIEVVGTIFP